MELVGRSSAWTFVNAAMFERVRVWRVSIIPKTLVILFDNLFGFRGVEGGGGVSENTRVLHYFKLNKIESILSNKNALDKRLPTYNWG